jgi:hypothetical protein
VTGPTDDTASWVLEIKARLEDPPPLGPSSTNGDSESAERRVVAVPLWVESGELWCGFVEGPAADLWAESPLTFPEAAARENTDPWLQIAELVPARFGVDPATVLKLGRLDVVTLADDRQLMPMVVALPTPGVEGGASFAEEIVGIPLSVLSQPTLIEQKVGEVHGREVRMQILHFGRHRLWGAAEWMVENLLQRLGLDAAV